MTGFELTTYGTGKDGSVHCVTTNAPTYNVISFYCFNPYQMYGDGLRGNLQKRKFEQRSFQLHNFGEVSSSSSTSFVSSRFFFPRFKIGNY